MIYCGIWFWRKRLVDFQHFVGVDVDDLRFFVFGLADSV